MERGGDRTKVKIVVGPGSSVLETRLSSLAIRHISEACSYEIDGFEFAKAKAIEDGSPWAHTWDGRKRLFHMGHRTFPSGLLDRVINIFQEDFGYDVDIKRVDEQYNPIKLKASYANYEQRDYQDQAVEAAVRNGRGVLRVATGGGKTLIAADIIASYSRTALFLVHTKDLLYQALEVFQDIFGERMVGRLGDGAVDFKPITVATIQSVSRALNISYVAPDDEDDAWLDVETPADEDSVKSLLGFDVIFMDECHRVAAPVAMSVMERLTGSIRFGLSASPWRDDGADMCIEAAIGPIIYEMNASELYRRGFLVAPIIRMWQTPAMAFKRGVKYDTVYNQYIVGNEVRNSYGVDQAIRMMHTGKPTLILVRMIRHGYVIQDMISDRLGACVPFLSGKDSSLFRKEVVDDMRNRRLGLLIASTIADEGLDIRPLAGLVNLGGGKSSTKAMQRVGRTLRPYSGKTHAEIIDFDDRARYLSKHSVARRKLYETEDEWMVTDV